MNASPQKLAGLGFQLKSVIKKTAIWLVAVCVMLLSESLLAQNPLRAQATHGQHVRTPQYDHHVQPPSQTAGLAVPPRDAATSEQHPSAIERITQQANAQSWMSQPAFHRDRDVQRTNFNVPVNVERRAAQRPAVDDRVLQSKTLAPADRATGQSSEMNFIERENRSTRPSDAELKPKKENLGQLISKLGMNLAFVLSLGIGGILIAKQWIKPQSIRRASPKRNISDNHSMQIVETLRVDAKTTLHLVECGKSSILLATDAAGVKSVTLLSPSFDAALLDDPANLPDEIDTDTGATPRSSSRLKAYRKHEKESRDETSKKSNADGMDEKLIRMLLENSKKRQLAG